MTCDVCGKKMRSRGYGNHLLQTHQMKLTQVTEKRKPHVSEKAPHVSERRLSQTHVSEKPITVVSKELVTTKRVYTPFKVPKGMLIYERLDGSTYISE